MSQPPSTTSLGSTMGSSDLKGANTWRGGRGARVGVRTPAHDRPPPAHKWRATKLARRPPGAPQQRPQALLGPLPSAAAHPSPGPRAQRARSLQPHLLALVVAEAHGRGLRQGSPVVGLLQPVLGHPGDAAARGRGGESPRGGAQRGKRLARMAPARAGLARQPRHAAPRSVSGAPSLQGARLPPHGAPRTACWPGCPPRLWCRCCRPTRQA